MQELEIFKKKLNILSLQKECAKLEQVPCPVVHDFADGVYVRKTTMPAGTFAIGKCHKFKTYNILLRGKITVYMGEHVPVREFTAPCTFTSDAGIKKIAFFHEETEWLNIHPTEETDLEKIEKAFIIPDTEFVLADKEMKLCLG